MTRRTKVYLASPFWDKDAQVRRRNVERSIIIANSLRDAGYLPFWPLHSYYEHILCPRDEAYWLAASLEWVSSCDCMLRQGGPSRGAHREVELALEIGMSVYYTLTRLLDVEPVTLSNVWRLHWVDYKSIPERR